MVNDIDEYLREHRLRWFGHVDRREILIGLLKVEEGNARLHTVVEGKTIQRETEEITEGTSL